MEYTKKMKERIKRTRRLFRELGCGIFQSEYSDESYSAGFQFPSGFHGIFFIDQGSKFLEIGYSFSFSPLLSKFLQERMNEVITTCYEYGCYPNLVVEDKEEIHLSVYSKLYFDGLNYSTLKETLRDFKGCVVTLKSTLRVKNT